MLQDENNQSASDWAADKADDAKEGLESAGEAVKEDWEQTKKDVKDPDLSELTENKMLGNEGDTSDDKK
jgi:hypothetical protein